MARRILARKALSPVTPEPLRLPPPLENFPGISRKISSASQALISLGLWVH
jgi:hypothetical protein